MRGLLSPGQRSPGWPVAGFLPGDVHAATKLEGAELPSLTSLNGELIHSSLLGKTPLLTASYIPWMCKE